MKNCSYSIELQDLQIKEKHQFSKFIKQKLTDIYNKFRRLDQYDLHPDAILQTFGLSYKKQPNICKGVSKPLKCQQLVTVTGKSGVGKSFLIASLQKLQPSLIQTQKSLQHSKCYKFYLANCRIYGQLNLQSSFNTTDQVNLFQKSINIRMVQQLSQTIIYVGDCLTKQSQTLILRLSQNYRGIIICVHNLPFFNKKNQFQDELNYIRQHLSLKQAILPNDSQGCKFFYYRRLDGKDIYHFFIAKTSNQLLHKYYNLKAFDAINNLLNFPLTFKQKNIYQSWSNSLRFQIQSRNKLTPVELFQKQHKINASQQLMSYSSSSIIFTPQQAIIKIQIPCCRLVQCRLIQCPLYFFVRVTVQRFELQKVFLQDQKYFNIESFDIKLGQYRFCRQIMKTIDQTGIVTLKIPILNYRQINRSVMTQN